MAADTATPSFDLIIELFDKAIDRHIEEVVKVDQTSTDVVRHELEEYVPTASIKRGFREILAAYSETPNKPHEGIGIWISGFFGAGKSSFAKILGYILENRQLGDVTASELFAQQAADAQLQALLAKINREIPTRAVIFDVSTDQEVTDTSEKLTDIVYRILLRELGYPTDRDLAELEIDLEREERLELFKKSFEELFEGKHWDELKHFPSSARNRASRVLHELEPKTYPNEDSWAHTPRDIQVSANMVARRTFELARRRADNRAIVFVIDEVGQYVARSTDKMLDLQGLIQALGKEGRNRAAEWRGQVWLVATSQERLTEVVDNLEGKQVELARLKDRFQIEVDMAPSDIREVTSQRVLKKKPTAAEHLRSLYEASSGRLGEATRVTGRLEGGELNADTFAELYPFLPYQIPLLIEIVSGLRTQGGASRQVGGSNRTIIKQAQQVLINDRTNLGEERVGRLVTLDQIYELLEGLVTNDRRRDVHEIEQELGRDTMATKVAKALALLQFVGTFPRTAENVAAALHPAVDSLPQTPEVEEGIDTLRDVGKVRETEQGWELLSRVGKDWEEERRGIDPFGRNRSEILRDTAAQLFEEVGGYRHRKIRTFRALPVVDGHRLGLGGDVEVHVRLLTDSAQHESARGAARQQSNTEEGRNALHWVVPLPDELIAQVDDLYRSREMIRRHERGHHSPEEGRLLGDEKSRATNLQGRITTRLRRVFQHGDSFQHGVQTPLAEHGDDLPSVVRGALRDAVPRLYEKFDLAAVSVRGGDAAKVLDSESLSGLPAVYYAGDGGLGLVGRQGGEQTIADDHPALTEVISFIEERHGYNEEASGRALENRFTGFGYGWDAEVVRLLTAAALRATRVEVYSGRRYTSYADPGVREVFRKTNTFRSALFVPRQDQIDFDTLAESARAYEDLYGSQVSIEEGAIATALRKIMPGEANRAHRALSRLEAHHLPGADEVRSLHEKLRSIAEGSATDTILAFHGQLDLLREGIDELRSLEEALEGTNLETLIQAREAVTRLWPDFEPFVNDEALAGEAASLHEALDSPNFHHDLPTIGQRSRKIRKAYGEKHAQLAGEIRDEMQQVLDQLRNRPDWEIVSEHHRHELEGPFLRIRAQASADSTSLSELASHRHALPYLASEATARLLQLHAELTRSNEDQPEPVIRRLRASRFAQSGLRGEEDVDKMIEALREACMEAIAKGETVILE